MDSLDLGPPDRIVLIYTDRSDPVTCVLLDQPERFDCEVIPISMHQLLSELVVGSHWALGGRTLERSRTAIVNRLRSLEASGPAGWPLSPFQRTELWMWLHAELPRFAYASSRPTVHSAIGGYGSLLDQWLDLPHLVRGLRVPVHQTPWNRERLEGDVYIVNPSQLYSLGRPAHAAPPGPGAQLAYVRPDGMLVHVAQVGSTFFLANAPPGMTPVQHAYIASFVESMASLSQSRILEHAFFVGGELPVFYATFPVPILTGNLPAYPGLVVEGLKNDVKRRGRRAA